MSCPSKLVLHTTETSQKPNWEQQQSGIPHLTVNLKTKERWQHLPFDIAAYTMSGGDHSPNSDGGGCIQIEIIGYTRDCPSWPQADYDELASILEWLCNNLGIPFTFPLDFAAPVREGWDDWAATSGILGHVHAPYNTHTDPMGLRVDLLLPYEPEPEPEPPTPTADTELRAILLAGLVDIHDSLASLIRDLDELG